MQTQPLTTALEDGFTSVEVDLQLIRGKIMVGHTASDAQAKNLTLEQAYLAPLQERVHQHGAVYPDGSQVTLMLDIKGNSESTYSALRPLLASYHEMLAQSHNGQTIPGPVRIVITGNQPALTSEQDRSVFLDAKLAEVLAHPEQVDSQLSPCVSGDFRRYFRWNGSGTMPAKEQEKLAKMVEDVHDLGLELRLWAAPDNPNTWNTLHHHGVDRINTDDLDGYARWQEQQSSG